MLDWRILSASFIALLFISFTLVGGLNIRELVGNVINKISNLIGTPLGNPQPQEEGNLEIQMTIYPKQFTLPVADVDIATSSAEFSNFKGDIKVDIENKKITLVQSGTDLVINLPIQKATIGELKLSRLVIENIEMSVKTGKWDIKSVNGSVELTGFSGKGIINEDSIEFTGTVSKFTRL